MPISVDQFQELLTASGLPAGVPARAFLDKLSVAERPKDGPAFARLLVQQGLLSQFQANMVARGNPQFLVLKSLHR